MRRWIVTIGAVIIGGFGSVAEIRANLIENGDFETGDLSNWSVSGSADVILIDVWGNDGETWAFRKTDGGGTLTQQLYLKAGFEYEVYWEQGLRNVGEDIPEVIQCNIIVRIDNDPYIHGWFHGSAIPSGYYTSQQETKTFFASETGYHDLKIQLVMPNRNGLEMLIDNVGVTPEPASISLFLFAGFLLAYRNRKGRIISLRTLF